MRAAQFIFSLLLLATASFAATPAHPNFSGMWQNADTKLIKYISADEPAMRPEIKARVENFTNNFDVHGIDDQGRQCVIGGMPWTMTSRVPYPIEILQSDKRITMLFELNNLRRNIYFGLKTPPEEIFASSEGFSIGHWEGQTLVIETTMLKDSSEFTLRPHSAKAHIIERWNRVMDKVHGETIVIDMLIDDPVIYTQPVKAHQVYKRSPPNTWVGEYACEDSLWETTIAKRKLEIDKARAAVVK